MSFLLALALLSVVNGNDLVGAIEGDVIQCVSYGDERYVPNATVSDSDFTTETDINGHFVILARPGTHTVTARSGDLTGHRDYVPVIVDGTIDIGGIELDPASAVNGCGLDAP